MSELKVVSQSDVMWNPWYRKYYYKTEADRVITHHKYKRCLAMAKWCMSEYLHCKTFDFTNNNNEQWYWRRWHIRWLTLSNKFKTCD